MSPPDYRFRWQDFDHRHLALGQGVPLNGHDRKRFDVDVRAQLPKSPQQLVVDGETADGSVVTDSDDEVPRLPVIGKVVGEGADRLAELVRIRRRDCELDAVGLPIGDQHAQLIRCQHDSAPTRSLRRGTIFGTIGYYM